MNNENTLVTNNTTPAQQQPAQAPPPTQGQPQPVQSSPPSPQQQTVSPQQQPPQAQPVMDTSKPEVKAETNAPSIESQREPTPPVQEDSKKDVKMEEKKDEGKKKKEKKKKGRNKKKKKATSSKEKPSNLSRGIGINLIPPKSEQEIFVESTKSRVSISAAFAVLVLVALSVGIVGFNAVTKFRLNDKKEELYALESEVRKSRDVLGANNEILSRITLYEDIKESTFSTKDIIDYWFEVGNEYATIENVELSRQLTFSVSGYADSLESVARFWNFLGNDARILEVNLDNVVKDNSVTRFEFEGRLNFDEFRDNG